MTARRWCQARTVQLFMGGGKNFFNPIFSLLRKRERKRAQCERLRNWGSRGGGAVAPWSASWSRVWGRRAGFEGAEPLAGSGAQEKFWKLGLVRPRKIEFPGPKRAKSNVFGNHGANTKQQATKMHNDCQNKLENQHIIPYMRTAKVRSWQTFSKWEAIWIFSTLHPRKERKRAHCERLQTGADLDWPGRGTPEDRKFFRLFADLSKNIFLVDKSLKKIKFFSF